MEDAPDDLADLLARARAGSQDAARTLYDRYARDILRVVRARLHRELRRRYDSLDFTQEVWASFFTMPRERFNFKNPEELIAFLSGMVYNKIRQTRRRLDSNERRAGPETSLDEEPCALSPSPSQHAQADDRWRQLTRDLSCGHRRMLELARDGHSYAEIADRLGVDRDTVRRLIEALRLRLVDE